MGHGIEHEAMKAPIRYTVQFRY